MTKSMIAGMDSRLSEWATAVNVTDTSSEGAQDRWTEAKLLHRVGDRAFVEAVFKDQSAEEVAHWIDSLGLEGVSADDLDITEILTNAGTIRVFVGGLMSRELVNALGEPGSEMATSFVTARPVTMTSGVGDTTSQGDAAQQSDEARTNFSVDGAGITVGVISDSMAYELGSNGVTPTDTTYAEDIASGDLPSGGVNIIQDGVAISPDGDEGRAMAQIVHDVAPGADIAFHTAIGTQATFANGINALAGAGSDIIVDDIIYFAEPIFQDGIIAQAAANYVDAGGVYFSSAGNSGDDGVYDIFRDSGVDGSTIGALSAFAGGTLGSLHDWNPDSAVFSPYVELTAGAFDSFTLSFQWDEGFASSGGSGSTADFDIFITEVSGGSETVIDAGFSNNIGGDAVEIVGIPTNTSGVDKTYRLYITEFDPSDVVSTNFLAGVFFGAGGQFVEDYNPVVLGDGGALIDAPQFAAPTVFGHANADGVLAVGASAWFNTPEFNGALPAARLNTFSSEGGFPILVDVFGNPTFDDRDGVDFVAPDGGNTTFFGSDTGADADTFPNFFGTSASAPHAAAVAALMLQVDSGLTPIDIEVLLQESATPVTQMSNGTPVGTSFTGSGFIDANVALGLIGATIAVDDSFTTTESSLLAGNVLDDNGLGPDTDTDGGFLGLSAVNGESADIGVQITLASGALLTVNGNGTFDYDPNGAFDALNEGSIGFDSFDYTLTDGGSGTDIGFVEIVVIGEGAGLIPLIGTPGNDTLIGTSADEFIDGLAGKDSLNGREGDDSVLGGDGNDTVRGQDGDDTVDGGLGGDTVRGDNGNDLLTGGDGNDNMGGGADNDTMDGGAGIDLIKGEAGDDVLTDFGDGSRLFGGSGNDTITSGDFDDTIKGGDGEDSIMSGGGVDDVLGQDGDDWIDLGDGDDEAQGGNDNDYIFGGLGLDRIEGNAGDDTIEGGDDFDRLIGKSGDDILRGQNGDDRLSAGIGLDTLEGGEGEDFLRAGGDADEVNGGTGDDTMEGNGGDDTFIIAMGDGMDVISDFDQDGDDVLEFQGFGTDFDEASEILAVASQSGGDVLIDFGTGQTLTLDGLNLADLGADDITFG